MRIKPETVPALLSFGPLFMVIVGSCINVLIAAQVMGTPGVLLGTLSVLTALIGAVGLGFGLCVMLRRLTALEHQVACLEQLPDQKALDAREDGS